MVPLSGDAARVHVNRPAATGPALDALFRVRLAELADDLKLPRAPAPTFADGDPALAIDDDEVRIERDLRRSPGPDTEAANLAERLAAALFRARWRLLEPALRAADVPSPSRLRPLVGFGLDLDDLRHLDRKARGDAEGREWLVAELCPPHAALLTSEPDKDRAPDLLEVVAAVATERAGVSLPALDAVRDRGLARGQARFRLRRVRGPVIAPGARPEEMVPRLIAGYARHAAMFVDAASVTGMLLDAEAAPLPLAADALRAAGPVAMAAALRRLLDANVTLPQPRRLWAALLAPAADLDRGADRAIVVPGHTLVAADAGLGARLRAALVPLALLRRSGPGERRSVWRMPSRAVDGWTADALADAALPCARADAALLVPNGQGWRIRDLLAGDYPALLVAEDGEWPPEVDMLVRGQIAPGSTP